MSNKEKQSIAYIYNEMDPSEKIEFERDLEKDNNLLIEVESFKNVSEKLCKLKYIEPPCELSEAVINRAAVIRRRQQASQAGKYRFAAAALLVIGLTSGFFLLNTAENTDRNETGSAMMGAPEMSWSTEATHIERELNDVTAATLYNSMMNNESGRVEPWVDENDVIHFYDRFQTANQATLDSMYQYSYQKLTPVTDPAQSKSIQRHLHLTGSQR